MTASSSDEPAPPLSTRSQEARWCMTAPPTSPSAVRALLPGEVCLGVAHGVVRRPVPRAPPVAERPLDRDGVEPLLAVPPHGGRVGPPALLALVHDHLASPSAASGLPPARRGGSSERS